MLSTAQGLKDLTGNVHIDTLECRNLSASNFDISNLAVATSLLPTQDNVVDLGSNAKRFKRAYVNDIDLGVARASKQLKTDASGVVAFDPLLSVGTSNGLTLNNDTQVLDMALASATSAGAIASTTYNDIVANTASRHSAVTLGTSNGLSLSGQQLSLQTASTTQPGAASASLVTDVTANTAARHSAVTLGTSNGLSLSGQQLSLTVASATTTGALSSTDWSTFNNKQPTLLTSVALPFENVLMPVGASPPYSLTISNHLTAGGRLGVGLAGYDSSAKLHVRDTTSGVRAVLDVNGAPYTGTSVGLWFGNTAQNYPYAQIDGIDGQPVFNSVFLGDLSFKTNTNQTMNEQMRIKASGNIGMGTSSPQVKLHIASDTSAKLTLSGGSDQNKQLVLGYDVTANNGYVQSVQQGVSVKPLLLNPSGGLVSVNTTQSKATCQVGATTHAPNSGVLPGLMVNSNNNWIAVDAGPTDTGNRVVMGNLSNQATIGGHDNGFDTWKDLCINPSADGKVGVGTSAPAGKLHVNNGNLVCQNGGAYWTKIPIDLSFALWGSTYKVKLNAYQYGPRVRFEMSGYGGSGTAHIYQRYVWAARADGNASGYANWDVNQPAGLLSISYSASEYACTFTYYGNNYPSLFAEFEYLGPDPNPTVSIT